jgi:putative ABC transport system permease protein
MGVQLTTRNLLHEKGKLILHVSGIAATLTLVILLLGLRDGMYASLTAYIDHTGADLIVAQLGSNGFFSATSTLPATLHDAIGETAGAAEIDHILVSNTIFTNGQAKTPVLLIGFDLDSGFGGPWNINAGRPLQNDTEILLDTWLAWRSGLQVGDDVSLFGRTFTMVGTTRETSSWMSPYMFVSLPAAEATLHAAGDATFFLIRLPDSANRSQVVQAVEDEFPTTAVFTPAEMAAVDQKYLATILDRPISLMILISSVIAVAVMGLITYTTVMGRLREYSVLKALGASNRWLQWIVAKETIYRTILGFMIGTLWSYLVADLIMQVWPQFTVVIRPQIIPIIGIAALFMTVVAALWPIQRVTTADPAVVFKT